jgi:hypothetical protein
MVEEFICKCVYREINKKFDICRVLALDRNIVDYIITELITKNYLKNEGEKLFFTKQGRELYNRCVKLEEKNKNVTWYYDGLQPEYGLEFFDREDGHVFMSFRNIEKKGNVLLITPKTFPEYIPELHYKELSYTVQEYYSNKAAENEDGIVNITNFNMINDREVQYHEYLIMMFRSRDNKYKLLAYDPCSLTGINQRVTKNLLKLYEADKLKEMVYSENNKNFENILDAFENYSVESILGETFKDEEEEKVHVTEEDNKSYSSYIMNYEIREKFLYFLKNADDSLYIISPWMNYYIMNKEFLQDVENLLRRNVKLRIIYGITSSESKDKEYRDRRTEELANKLRSLGEPYGDLLKVEHGQTHEKLCICDRKYYINGSFNFLSYSGEDDDNFRNEGSTYSEDAKLIKEVISKRFRE